MRMMTGKMAAVLVAGVLAGSAVMKAQTSSTVKDDLFAGTEKFAQNASSVTEVDMDPDSLDMVNGHNASKARRTVLSVVHTYNYEKPGMYNMADVEVFRNKLNTGDWHCSVHVRELKSGESTDVCRKHRNDDLEETAIITVEPRELTFIHTIRRPASSGSTGKPSGPSEAYAAPFEYGFPGMEGMPRQAWAAEMRANAAEMRALALADRAEMGFLPGMRLNLMIDGFQDLSIPAFDLDRLRELNRQIERMPRYELRRAPETPAMPAVPSAPKNAPAAPKLPAVPAAPASPQGISGTQSLPAPPLPPVHASV